MAKLKDSIREAAQRLFAENGYDAVTLRAIAEEAGTTIGNLTYHYKQKEDLVAAIQKESQANSLVGLGSIPHEPLEVVRFLYRMAERAQKGHEENTFYFRNMIELCGRSAIIHSNTTLFREKLYDYYVECFDRLRTSGHMRRDLPVRNYWNLAYTLITLITVWTQNTSPFYDAHVPHLSLQEALASLLHPYFTPLGLELVGQVAATDEG